MKGYGFLAIWCDIGSQDLEDYRNWLTREHIADRTFCPGFLGVRLFTALDDETSHFILYATEGPEVLESPPYLDILNNPSAWTRRIMPRFGPFDRASGRQAIKLGNGYGAFVAVCRVDTAGEDPAPDSLATALGRLLEPSGVVSVRLMIVDRSATDIRSEEKTMRTGKEGDFRYLVCVEATSEGAVRHAAATARSLLTGVFTSLTHFDVSTRKVIYGEAPYEGPTDR